MTTRLYGYGVLLKSAFRPDRKRKGRGSKVARELAGGDLIGADGLIGDGGGVADAWPPAFVIDGWPPPPDGLDGWPPRLMDQEWPPRDAGWAFIEAGWPGGSAWAATAWPFPPEPDPDPFARSRDIDPQSPKGRWLAGMDRNFGPGWEEWDGHVTVDVNRN